MPTYLITEKAGACMRQGQLVEAAGLAEAKKLAGEIQMFQRTFVTIEQGGVLLAVLTEEGKWEDLA